MTQKVIRSFYGVLSALLLGGCGATTLVSTPIENIDTIPLKVAPLTESQKKHWSHLDLVADTIPGMSVDKAYAQIIGTKKGDKVIVAVLDSGIDLTHEDLKDVLWTNKGEKPGNGQDDDHNGYIDDIHGYNFLGDSYNEQKEAARIVKNHLGDPSLQAKAKKNVDSEVAEAQQNKQQYEQILQAVQTADTAVKQELGKSSYTKKDLAGIIPKDEAMQQYVGILMQMYTFNDSIPEVIADLNEGIAHFSDQLEYNDNINFDGRKIVGDNPYDLTDTNYGNGNPQAQFKGENHGTHVAGIIAAERNNGIGMDGVANNVAIMSIRAVPNGDEYDKDIALGIRYAVDNGAKIINASFGKDFSPNAQWVYDAIKYAADHDVLIVHAAGNDGENLDDPNNQNFPNDQIGNEQEFADNVITVGALEPKYGSELLASYSNYGKRNVDIFAPGTDIYSTMPHNKYQFMQGTSMASPEVAGIAALIRSQYPSLTASQVKHIILDSGLASKIKVILAGNPTKSASLEEIATPGKIANAYNALILASEVVKGKIKI